MSEESIESARVPDRDLETEVGYSNRRVAHPRRWLPDDVLAVAGREYRIVVRSRWTVGVAALFAVFTATIVLFGASGTGSGRFDAVAASVAELGVYLVPLVGLAFGYDTVVGADESGTLEILFALPIRQGQVVVGKYLGRAFALAAAVLVGFVPGAALAMWLAGTTVLGTYAIVALAAVATALAFLAVSVLISTVTAEKTHALGGVLAAWLWFVLLHDLAALAAISAFDLSGTAVAAMVLTNPADAFRVLVLSTLDTVSGGFGAVLAEANLSVPLVTASLVAWTVGALGLAAWRIRARRL